MTPAGVYIHIPFCKKKCTYCDFCSFAGLESLFAPYVQAVCRQIAQTAVNWASTRFDTVYIGGGTPTVLPPASIASLLAACRQHLDLEGDAEITIEANPGTVDKSSLAILRGAGINRLSLGVQSFRNQELDILGRIHDQCEARQAYHDARGAGFECINLDLMFALPRQSLDDWRANLSSAMDLAPDHLSLYALTLEKGTPLAERIAAGQLSAPDDELAATMYELAERTLGQAGYLHYEISNWAKRGTDGASEAGYSRHNLHYWHNEHYLGLGAVAVTYDGQRRTTNVSDPASYVAQVRSGGAVLEASETTPLARQMDETMMLGLRLIDGVSWNSFRERFAVGLEEAYGPAIDELVDEGLLESDERGIRLTPRGRLLGNRVFARFLR